MRFLTTDQMRTADQVALRKNEIPGLLLMRRAGIALTRAIMTLANIRNTRKIVLVAGHGNNGGDICMAARCLHEDGFRVHVLMTCVPAQLRGDAHAAWDEMRTSGIPYTVLATPESWTDPDSLAVDLLGRPCIVVDGVLGIGCQGAPKPTAACAIRWINQMRADAFVVAADLPSGMNGDTGEAAGEVVHADLTVSFARPKKCFLNDALAEKVGHLTLADIGLDAALCDVGTSCEPCELIALPELVQDLPPAPWTAHKGVSGRIGIVGGSTVYPHAPVLAGLGALKSGAGLVTLFVPSHSASAAASWIPEAILRPVEISQGRLSLASLQPFIDDLNGCDVIVLGPGLSQTPETSQLVANLLGVLQTRMVLDADGLAALADLRKANQWQPRDTQQLILTPHPGEAARLLDVSTESIQNDRLAAVRRLADLYQATVILKGSGTLVCAPGKSPLLNRTGNPGMATGGTGDVLAGMVAALWTRQTDPVKAASLATWAHGTAGDFATFIDGPYTLTATALAGQLGKALSFLL